MDSDDSLRERIVHFICPHCGAVLRIIVPDSGEVVCLSCGSAIHLASDAATNNAELLPAAFGRFVVLARLGAGAFGTVYKARDPELDRIVAVKVPRAGTFATADAELRFRREAQAAARLAHPGIVAVHEIISVGPVSAIVSEFIDGITLADRLTAGRPTVRESAEWIASIADALDFAHRSGIVHRDVKPANVLLDLVGKPHLTDFGLARRDDPAFTVSLDGAILGTPAYMSPEQAAGNRAVDGRADVYSLGVMLYELLTGERPFRGNSRMLLHQVMHDDPRPPRVVNDLIPRDLETVCLKCLAKAPAKRYATAGELAADLHRWLNGRSVLARRPGRIERVARWVRRNPTVAALSLAVALTLVAGTGVSAWYASSYRHAAEKLEASLVVAQRREGLLAIDQGVTECGRGDPKAGLLWFAHGLELLERTQGDEIERWYARMQLSLWGQHLTANPLFNPDGGHVVLRQAEFTLDGRCLIAEDMGGDTSTFKIRRFDLDTGATVATFTLSGRAPGPRPRIRIGADGRLVAATGSVVRGEARVFFLAVWDAATGALLRTTEWAPLTTQADRVTDRCWSPNLELTLSEDERGYLRVWDTVVGRPTATLDVRLGDGTAKAGVPDQQLIGYAFSPDARTVIGIVEGGAVRVWDTTTGRRRAEIRHTGGSAVITRIAFSPDGVEFATGGPDGAVRRWDVRAGQAIGEPLNTSGWAVDRLSYTTDSRWLEVMGPSSGPAGNGKGPGWFSDFPIAAWERETGRMWDRPDVLPSWVSSDQRYGMRKDGVQIVDMATGRPTGRRLPGEHYFDRFDTSGRVFFTQGMSFFLPVRIHGPTSPAWVAQGWDTARSRPLGPPVPTIDAVRGFDPQRGRLIRATTHHTRPGETRTGLFVEHHTFEPIRAESAEAVMLWAQLLTGQELDEEGNLRSLPADVIAERTNRLNLLGGVRLPP